MPLTIAPSIRAIIAVRTTPSVSTPASRIPATSSNLKPSRRCITSTRRVTSAGMWARHDVAGLAELAQHRRDVEHVGGLDAEVELLDDGVGEQLDERRRVGQGGDRDAADEVRRQPRHRPQVVVHEAGDVGALHLDDDVLARAQARGVHLGDRRRGERRHVERGEHVVERSSEVGLDGAPARRRTAPPAPGRGIA